MGFPVFFLDLRIVLLGLLSLPDLVVPVVLVGDDVELAGAGPEGLESVLMGQPDLPVAVVVVGQGLIADGVVDVPDWGDADWASGLVLAIGAMQVDDIEVPRGVLAHVHIMLACRQVLLSYLLRPCMLLFLLASVGLQNWVELRLSLLDHARGDDVADGLELLAEGLLGSLFLFVTVHVGSPPGGVLGVDA